MTDYDAREGRSDFALAGVGYDGCCFPKSRAQPYVAASGKDYDRVRWLFRGTGIGPGQAFGVANSESDRVDPRAEPARPRDRGAGDHARQARRHPRGDDLVARRSRAGLRDRQLHLPADGPRDHLQAARQRMAQSSWASLSRRSLLAGCGGSVVARAARRADAAARAAARADRARPGEGDRPAVAERLARALRGPDALLGDRRRAGPGRVVGRRPGRPRLDVPPAQGHPLERRHADHGRRLPPLVAARARGRARARPTPGPSSGSSAGRGTCTRPATARSASRRSTTGTCA